MPQGELSGAGKSALRSQKYYRVETKSGKPHLGFIHSGDTYETFCGRTINVDILRVAISVKCYRGDECVDCQSNVDVWVRMKDPETPWAMEPKIKRVIVVRLPQCPKVDTP